MKLNLVVLAGLTMTGIILPFTTVPSTTVQAVIAQEKLPEPGTPQQNDRRAAIARVNPKRPIQIRVISQTNVPLVTSVVAATRDRPLAPGQSVTFGRLHTSYLNLPLNLQVTMQDNPDPKNPIGVSLEVKTAGNEIILSAKTSASESGPSSRAIRVDDQGLIYLY